MEKVKTKSIAIVTAALMFAAVALWIILMLLGVGKKEFSKAPGKLAVDTNPEAYSIVSDNRRDGLDISEYGTLYFLRSPL